MRHILFAVCLISLAGCSPSKNSAPEDDLLSQDISVPATKPLNPGQTVQAKNMWNAVAGVEDGLDSLGDTPGGPQPLNLVKDAITENCKAVEDQSNTGNHYVIESHTESLSGHSCPVLSQSRTDLDFAALSNGSYRLAGTTSTRVDVVAEPLLTLIDLRRVIYSGSFRMESTSVAAGSHIRNGLELRGSLDFATLTAADYFVKMRGDIVKDSYDKPLSGKSVAAFGALVNGAWYVVRIERSFLQGLETVTCTLNGTDVSSDPLCKSSSTIRSRVGPAAVQLAYGK